MRQVHLKFYQGPRRLNYARHDLYAEEVGTRKGLELYTWWLGDIPIAKENLDSPTKAYCEYKGIG